MLYARVLNRSSGSVRSPADMLNASALRAGHFIGGSAPAGCLADEPVSLTPGHMVEERVFEAK